MDAKPICSLKNKTWANICVWVPERHCVIVVAGGVTSDFSARLSLFCQSDANETKETTISTIDTHFIDVVHTIDTLFRKERFMLNFPWPSQFFGWPNFMGHKIKYALAGRCCCRRRRYYCLLQHYWFFSRSVHLFYLFVCFVSSVLLVVFVARRTLVFQYSCD